MHFPIDYQLVMALCVGVCALLCILCMVFGAVCRSIGGYSVTPPLPFYQGVPFPGIWHRLVAVVYLLGYAYMTISPMLDPAGSQGVESASFEVLLVSVIIQNSLSIPLLILLLFVPTRPDALSSIFRSLPYIAACMVIVFIVPGIMEVCGLFKWMQSLLDCPEQQDVVQSFSNGVLPNRILIGITACVLAPIVEEAFFRGFLYSTLRHWSGPITAALCSSFFFASVHGSPIHLLPLALFALVQCYLYERFRTLWVPVIFHAAYNTLNLLLILNVQS